MYLIHFLCIFLMFFNFLMSLACEWEWARTSLASLLIQNLLWFNWAIQFWFRNNHVLYIYYNEKNILVYQLWKLYLKYKMHFFFSFYDIKLHTNHIPVCYPLFKIMLIMPLCSTIYYIFLTWTCKISLYT